jgi:GH24 family phage-related lysozyme (muramidase)
LAYFAVRRKEQKQNRKDRQALTQSFAKKTVLAFKRIHYQLTRTQAEAVASFLYR